MKTLTTLDMNITTLTLLSVIIYSIRGSSSMAETVHLFDVVHDAHTTKMPGNLGDEYSDPLLYFAKACPHVLSGSRVAHRDGKMHIAYISDYYGNHRKVAVATFNLTEKRTEGIYVVDADYANDAHHSPHLAMDKEGYIHIIYGGWNKPFRYKRSVRPNDASAWTDHQPVAPGHNTYPNMTVGSDNRLYVFFRGTPNNHFASLVFKDCPDGEWSKPRAIMKGAWSYPIGIAETNGRLHFSYFYRLGNAWQALRHGGYLYSDDRGKTLKDVRGGIHRSAITPDIKTPYTIQNPVYDSKDGLTTYHLNLVTEIEGQPTGVMLRRGIAYNGLDIIRWDNDAREWKHTRIDQGFTLPTYIEKLGGRYVFSFSNFDPLTMKTYIAIAFSKDAKNWRAAKVYGGEYPYHLVPNRVVFHDGKYYVQIWDDRKIKIAEIDDLDELFSRQPVSPHYLSNEEFQRRVDEARLKAALPSDAYVKEVPESGISFDGESRCIVIENGEPYNLNEITIEAWTRFKDTVGSQVLVNRGAAGRLFTFYLYKGRIRMLVEHQKGQYSHANAAVPPPGHWFHVCGSYDGENIKLYFNGVLVGETKARGRAPQSKESLTIGALTPGERHFNGEMEDVRVWNRALPQDQIREHLRAKIGEENLDQWAAEGLIGCWAKRSLKGEVAIDISPTKNHGKVIDETQ